MQGDAEVIEFLNEQLTAELTAINQYFLHAKMQENWGCTKLAKHTRARVDRRDEARRDAHRPDPVPGGPAQLPAAVHAADRPDRQGACSSATWQVEVEAVDRLRRGIEYMRAKGDITSANIFEDILADEEHHVDYLETQLELIEKLGEPLYLSLRRAR